MNTKELYGSLVITVVAIMPLCGIAWSFAELLMPAPLSLSPASLVVASMLAGPFSGFGDRRGWWLEAGIVAVYVCTAIYVAGKHGRQSEVFLITGTLLVGVWLLCGLAIVSILG